jgi:hypothetical protein
MWVEWVPDRCPAVFPFQIAAAAGSPSDPAEFSRMEGVKQVKCGSVSIELKPLEVLKNNSANPVAWLSAESAQTKVQLKYPIT